MTNNRLVTLAAGVAAAAFLACPAAVRAGGHFNAVLIASNCAVCHGPGGKSSGFTPGLDKLTKEVIADKLRKFRSDEKPSTIMHRFAKGFSDAQIDAIAAQLGK
ncbi:MAG: c-type cytochrome [Rhodospirillales bacterium]